MAAVKPAGPDPMMMMSRKAAPCLVHQRGIRSSGCHDMVNTV
jgi:hypothetical protein